METKLKLIKGRFSKEESLELLTQLIQVKIRFQENKILKSDNEEDIKMRERRIKQLQKEFYDAKLVILKNENFCELDSEIIIK